MTVQVTVGDVARGCVHEKLCQCRSKSGLWNPPFYFPAVDCSKNGKFKPQVLETASGKELVELIKGLIYGRRMAILWVFWYWTREESATVNNILLPIFQNDNKFVVMCNRLIHFTIYHYLPTYIVCVPGLFGNSLLMSVHPLLQSHCFPGGL